MTKYMLNKTNKLILALSVTAVVALLGSGKVGKVYAQDCTPVYGGGETCVEEKEFSVTKDVRIKGNSDWKDKVTGVEEEDTVEFRVKVKNKGNVEVDNMKMTDFLPDEMFRTGGDGLTEEWDNFKPGDTKEFIIEAKIESAEFDKANVDKCVVNKAKATRDGNKVGEDTATVCFTTVELKELPKTGNSVIELTALGLGLVSLGAVIKKTKFLA